MVVSSVPLYLQEEGQGMGQGDGRRAPPWSAGNVRREPVPARFVKAMESVLGQPWNFTL